MIKTIERQRILVRQYGALVWLGWDDFIRASKNGTFLFERRYMGYHANRFEDASLMLYDGDKLVAVLPAHRDGDRLVSHNGLTYGGLVVGPDMTLPRYLEIFDALMTELKAMGVRDLLYKASPSIYHRLPADEDLVALYLLGGLSVRTCALSVIVPGQKADIQERRERGIEKALRLGLKTYHREDDYPAMWDMLSDVLPGKPTHSLEEIQRLRALFPKNISLRGAFDKDGMQAGVVVYETDTVARAQYIAASEEGKQMGASDLLMSRLIEHYTAKGKVFDMGTSSNASGFELERGILDYKEGWGARTLTYSHYMVDVTRHEPGSLVEALR